MKRRCRQTIGWMGLLVMSSLLVVAGCSTGSDARSSGDSGPDEVVGQAPDEDSEDYEFATPPRHPGDHGDLRAPSTAERSGAGGHDAAELSTRDIDELKRLGPSVVMKHISTEPVHDDEKFVGFEIVELSASAQSYVAPKLQPGDVITHVNLVRLKTPDDYMEAWETLEEIDEIRVDLIRDGEPRELFWSVD